MLDPKIEKLIDPIQQMIRGGRQLEDVAKSLYSALKSYHDKDGRWGTRQILMNFSGSVRLATDAHAEQLGDDEFLLTDEEIDAIVRKHVWIVNYMIEEEKQSGESVGQEVYYYLMSFPEIYQYNSIEAVFSKYPTLIRDWTLRFARIVRKDNFTWRPEAMGPKITDETHPLFSEEIKEFDRILCGLSDYTD